MRPGPFLLVAALLACACTTGTVTGGGGSPARVDEAAQADPAGWKRVQATGPFSVAVPPGFERRYVMGIDSAVDEFAAPGVRLGFDYGMYSGGGLGPDVLDARTGTVSAQGRTTDWIIARPRGQADSEFPWVFRAHFAGVEAPPGPPPTAGMPPPPGVGLGVSLYCSAASACAVGPDIVRTIRFGPGRPLSARLAFLQRVRPGPAGGGGTALDGLLVVDSDGCLRIADTRTGRASPILVWPAEARLTFDGEDRARISGGLDELRVEPHSFALLTGREAPPPRAEELNRPVPEGCAGPVFHVASFETPRGREGRGAGPPPRR